MGKLLFIIIVYTMLVLSCFCNNAFSQTADALANKQTKCILQYFGGLSAKPNAKVISGQWMNWRGQPPNTPATEFDTVITSLYNQTSKWVGIIGTDYMREHFMPYSNVIENLKPVNQPLIDYSHQGGLVAVMVSWKNPWTGGSINDTLGSSNLLDIVTSGHAANTYFKKELDSIALGFQQLQDSGVTVLFRPFHEMNGNWFWWGSKSATLPAASDFVALWKYTFNYLTTTKKLHNILWYYTPSVRESLVMNPNFKTELFYYPGTSYVDIIGLDVYNDTLDIPNYAAIVAIGKPVGIAEFGPKKLGVTNNPFSYDYSKLINQIKSKYPAICHWISYQHFKAGTSTNWIYYSMCKQNNTTALLNDSWVITRDKIDYSNCLTTSITEVSTNNELNVFPNPFTNHTIIYSSREIKQANLSIYNSFGVLVREETNISGKSFALNRANLLSGIYFLRLTEYGKAILSQKILVTD